MKDFIIGFLVMLLGAVTSGGGKFIRQQGKQAVYLREQIAKRDSVNTINAARFEQLENSYDPADHVKKINLQD